VHLGNILVDLLSQMKVQTVFGLPIDILVANAGGGAGGLQDSFASSMNLELFKEVIERNLYGTVHILLSFSKPLF
jgi:NAD(P)-dependent dehydrogenase (short-subunit alcohol dehydrogenase family)